MNLNDFTLLVMLINSRFYQFHFAHSFFLLSIPACFIFSSVCVFAEESNQSQLVQARSTQTQPVQRQSIQKAIIAENSHQYETALKLYQHAFKQDVPPEKKIETLYGLIRVYQKLNRSVDAFDMIKKLENLSASIEDTATLIRNYRTIAIAYQSTGKNEIARDYYAVAVELARGQNGAKGKNEQKGQRDQKDELLLASLLNEQAFADTLIPDIKNALITFEESKNLYKKHNKTSQFIDTSLNQIQAEILSNNKRRTIEGLKSLKKYFPNTKTLNRTPSQLIRLGVLYRAAHMKFNFSGVYRKKAFLLYVQAKDKAISTMDSINLSWAEGYIGQLYSDEGKYADAISYTLRALAIAEEKNALQLQYKWQMQLARSYKADKQFQLSILSYIKTLDLLDKIGIQTFTKLDKSFEKNVAPVFNEYIDVLLTNALKLEDNVLDQSIISQNEQSEFIKVLKITHLRNVAKLKSNCRSTCTIKPDNTPLVVGENRVLIAPFLFRDRLITLAVLDSGIKYYQVSVKYKTFLEKKAKFDANSAQFYKWIVEPFNKYFGDISEIVFLENNNIGNFPFSKLKIKNGNLNDKYQVSVVTDFYNASK